MVLPRNHRRCGEEAGIPMSETLGDVRDVPVAIIRVDVPTRRDYAEAPRPRGRGAPDDP
jgi:hypothetical protein